jgi:hypothetical protein
MRLRGLAAYAPGALALALCLPAWWIDPKLAWAGYLAAWWFCAACVMGGLVNVWIHNLTGGEWGEAIRGPLLALSRTLPLLIVLFLPVLFGMHTLYSWTAEAERGVHWSQALARPEFKRTWLDAGFFVARSIAYLAIWLALAIVTTRPAWSRSRNWAVAALVIYAITTTFAAIDWIMSLVPLWHSTAFGLLILTGNGLAGAALGVLAATLRASASRSVLRDLGNILLTYVLLWAYIAFTQYLIIWAENLPDEIVWYTSRLQTHWWWVGCLLIAFHFFLPLLVLLSRTAKSAPLALAGLALALLVIHLVDAWWLTVPSVAPHSAHVLWLAPLAAAGLIALVGARALQGSYPLSGRARAAPE